MFTTWAWRQPARDGQGRKSVSVLLTFTLYMHVDALHVTLLHYHLNALIQKIAHRREAKHVCRASSCE